MNKEIQDRAAFYKDVVDKLTILNDYISPDDYVDAFDWIAINVCCKKCSKEVEWISLELS